MTAMHGAIRSTLLPVAAMTGWMALMQVPYLSVRTPLDAVRLATETPVIYQATGLCLFICSVAAVFRKDYFKYLSLKEADTSQKLFIYFCLYCLVTVPFSIDVGTSVEFAFIHPIVFISMLILWNKPIPNKFLVLAGCALFGYILLLWNILGVQHERTLGYIPPNDIAKVALIAAAFCMFGSKIFKIASFIALLVVVLFTQSRGTLLAAILFYCIVLFRREKLTQGIAVISVAMVFVGGVLIMDSMLGNPLLESIRDNVLFIDDAGRGLDSGFTGRSTLWSSGLEVFWQHPFFGNGLRTREGISSIVPTRAYNAHSGIINMLLDVGVVGGVLLVVAVLIAAYRRLGRSTADRVPGAFLFAGLLLWIYEPLYINIGSPVSLVMLFFMARPAWRTANARSFATGAAAANRLAVGFGSATGRA